VTPDIELHDVRTHFSHDPRNLMTRYHRYWSDVVSSEKHVGMTQASRFHFDENVASHGRGDVNVLESKASQVR
jgi:hypothetical protein